ncbi:MAG: ExbD/TolR family protein [Gemmatimonadales bacterium]
MSLRACSAALPPPPRADLNLTPMIDVMLVLLMIFMILVPALVAGVDLPVAANAAPRPPEPEEIVLTIDRRGRYVLATVDEWGTSSGWNPPRVVTAAELRGELTRLYTGRTRDRILYLKADTTLPFGVVERAIEAARRSGVRVVAAVAVTPPSPVHTRETPPPTP